jgi:hypothetical protein
VTAEIRTRAPAHLTRRPQPRRAEADLEDDQPTWLFDRLAWAALVVALLALVVVAGRSITAGGEPVGDDALVAIRARDVLSGELPLVGAAAPTLETAGVHHPAPLLYDALAVPVALFPGRTGLVVGVTLIDLAAVAVVFLVARRRGGPLLAIMATLETLAVAWAVGSATLMGPSPAGVVVLPFLAFVVLAWSVACGDVGLLPWAAGVGSFVVGTNLSYAVLVPALLGFAVVAAYLTRRRSVWLPLRTALATVVVLSVVWAQPLYEQFFGGPGGGNLTRLLRAGRHLGSVDTVGLPAAVQVVAKLVAMPPWWLRPSAAEAFEPLHWTGALPALAVALFAVLGLAGQLGVLVRDRLRTGDRAAMVVVAVALVAMAASLVTVDLTPAVPTGLGERLRWLWPVGAFGAFAGVGSWLRFVLDRMPGWRTLAVVGTTVVTVGFAGLTVFDLPRMGPALGTRDETAVVADELRDMLAAADLEGPVLVDCQETVVDPYCEAAMATLQRMGVTFLVPDAVHGLGEGRLRDRDDPVTLRLVVAVGGDQEVQPRSDAMLLDVHEALRAAEQRELADLKDDIGAAVADGRVELDDRGRELADDGAFPSLGGSDGEPSSSSSDPSETAGGRYVLDAEAIMASRPELVGQHRRELVAMVREDVLDVDAELAAGLDRYADLQTTWDRHTVALFVQPM